MVLAAAAARTNRIRLTSAVSVLSSDDPVRVFQDFATLDLLSDGRAEIMAGRGSFIESFPLFGYDLHDYDALFAEKLDLLLALRERSGSPGRARHRAPLDDLGVYPRPVQDPLPVWVAVGGTPESAVRAGDARPADGARRSSAGCPSGSRRSRSSTASGAQAGHDPLPAVSINSHGFIADSPQEAVEVSFAPVRDGDGPDRAGARLAADERERRSRPRDRSAARTSSARRRVIEKILFQHEIFGHDRFLIQFSVGTIPHDAAHARDRAPGHGGGARRAGGDRAAGGSGCPVGSPS